MNTLKQQLGLHTERAQQVGALLAKYRKKAGFTMRELGEMLGVTHTMIDKIEKAQREISLLEFVHICQALNLSELQVFTEISKIYHANPEQL